MESRDEGNTQRRTRRSGDYLYVKNFCLSSSYLDRAWVMMLTEDDNGRQIITSPSAPKLSREEKKNKLLSRAKKRRNEQVHPVPSRPRFSSPLSAPMRPVQFDMRGFPAVRDTTRTIPRVLLKRFPCEKKKKR